VIPDPPAAITKPLPESVKDLKDFEKQTKAVLEKVIPCTVCLRVGGATGSGVIISKDGLVLTAAHVSGDPGKDISIVMPDGRIVKAKTLGLNRGIDSGMVKITTEGEYPYCELGVSKDLKPGQWCVAVGHPGGFKTGRSPVVRVGRIGIVNSSLVQTDCTLVGGDSGGPLFDMKGRVIGIHSRIGNPIFANIHVPADTFRETWDLLVKGEKIGENDVWLGVRSDENAKDAKLGSVTPKSPAEEAGLKVGDVITKFDGKEIKTYDDMVKLLQGRKAGDEVTVVVKRGDTTMDLKIKLGKRPG
jgi:serine protease Do